VELKRRDQAERRVVPLAELGAVLRSEIDVSSA
jgi:hypothetical protein